MAIAVIGGTGQQGRGLARRFAAAGERVIVGSRDPDRARAAVAAWGETPQPIEVADNAAAAALGDAIVLAVPFASLDALLDELGPRLKPGSIVIDVTVPVTFVSGKMAMIDVAEGSAAEHVRARLPSAIRMAAAFKTIPASLLDRLDRSLDCDEFVCSDSDEARVRAAAMVELVAGVRAVPIGPLSRARFVEHLTALAIAVNRTHRIHDARFRVVGLP
jgi:8-hydroxy-5-deazaflavin:NADPH oxidoreductase